MKATVNNSYSEQTEITINTRECLRSITVGLFAVGGMIGGLLSGWVADRLGRKGAMFANNVLAVIAAILMASARYVNIYPLIMIGRVVIGINCGKCFMNL